MTNEDIIRMAREAGFLPDMFGIGIWDSKELNVFASLVAAAEREACAQVCVEQAKIVSNQANGKTVASHCAHYVRARGK